MEKKTEYEKTWSKFPCGPCELPLECSNCGTIITEENVIFENCEDDCDTCEFCSTRKCPDCNAHVCCGGCV